MADPVPFPLRPGPKSSQPEEFHKFPKRWNGAVWTDAEIIDMLQAYDKARPEHGMSETLMAVVSAWQQYWYSVTD